MIVTLLLAILLQAAPVAASRPVIRARSDLPPTRFVLTALPSAALDTPAFRTDTVPALRREAQAVLARYRIDDPVIRQRLASGLAAIAILDGRGAEAERLIVAQRLTETKAEARATFGLMTEAVAVGLQAPRARRCAAMAARIGERLDTADPAVVRDAVVRMLASAQTASVPFLAGAAVEEMDPEAKGRGSIGLLDGLTLAGRQMAADAIPPCRGEMSAALRTWLAKPANAARDIWTARTPVAAQLAGARPVAVAIWDSGMDPGQFAGQLAIDPAEPLDGGDNDGNGVVDDVHGPTFDAHLMPTREPVLPMSDYLRGRVAIQTAVTKGYADLGYGLDTAEARFFAVRAREASTAEQGDDLVGEGELRARGHGTSVASIVVDGAPFVRLYNLMALPFGEDPLPMVLSEDTIDRWVAMMPALGARLRGAGVRVVNMSWGFEPDEAVDRLLERGGETDPARARARSRAMYAKVRAGLDRLLRDCPDILFVAGSGNSNQPDDIFAAVPQTLGLPNLIVVGATGLAGEPTNFTTFGRSVTLYAKGASVHVRLPGCTRIIGQGTSYAAPQVARAAAGMLAVAPYLTPAQVIAGLTATATPGRDGIRLMHEAKAVEWARGDPISGSTTDKAGAR